MFVGVGGITATRQIHQLLLQRSFLCFSQEVIYNYEVHRSLLHPRGLLLQGWLGGGGVDEPGVFTPFGLYLPDYY